MERTKVGYLRISKAFSNQTTHGGEEVSLESSVTSTCTQICGNKQYSGKSCAKMVLVKVLQSSRPEYAFKAYAILDEQSNRSLANPLLFS